MPKRVIIESVEPPHHRPPKVLATILKLSNNVSSRDVTEIFDWSDITKHLTPDKASEPREPEPWRVIVLTGIHTRLALHLASHLDIDPAFFDSHILRASYQSPETKPEVKCFHLDVPEVESLAVLDTHTDHVLYRGAIALDYSAVSSDYVALNSLELRAFLLGGRLYRYNHELVSWFAYLHRISCWSNQDRKISVIITDPRLPDLLPTGVSVADLMRSPFASEVKQLGEEQVATVQALNQSWSQIRRGEDFVQAISSKAKSDNDVHDLATQVALKGWNELITHMRLDSGPINSDEILDLLVQRLENNSLGVDSKPLEAGEQGKSQPDWEPFLKRLAKYRDKDLKQTMASIHDKLETLERRPLDAPLERYPSWALPFRREPKKDAQAQQEERRSLNRIAYMGGLLLPFSIVAGVFSMAPDFAPGGRLFFAYWALTIPIVLVTLVLIYADTIRKNRILNISERGGLFDWVRRPMLDMESGSSGSSYASGSSEHQSTHSTPLQDSNSAAPSPAPSVRPPLTIIDNKHRKEKLRPETEELGWWRALGTVFGFRPQWAADDDSDYGSDKY